MPLRNSAPFRWSPHGCSDAIDASSAFKGAMRELVNYVPSPDTQDQWVPRPARDNLTNFTSTGAYNNPGVIAAFTVVGDFAYGLISSLRNPGRDEPFCVQLISGQVLPVLNVNVDNTPTTAVDVGATVKPQFAKVGGRILVTHPGFPGGQFNPDFTGTFTGNVHAGSQIIDGYIGILPNLLPGMALSGGAIPGGSVVLSTGNTSFTATIIGGGVTSSTFTVADPGPLRVGQFVAGQRIAGGFVTAVTGSSITFTGTLLADFTMFPGPAFVQGNFLVMSQNATADINAETITASSAGNRGIKFGWFDISNANLVKTGDTFSTDTIDVADVSGLQPGYLVAGAGIPADTTIIGITNPVTQAVSTSINTGDTSLTVFFGSPLIPGQVPPFILPLSGQTISGPALAVGTTVSGTPTIVASGANYIEVSVPLSTPAIQTIIADSATPGFLYTFSGVRQLILSQPATATASGVTLTFTGGSPSMPLWDAGDTAINGLPSTPIGVGQFNGRAFFACGLDGIPFSDSLAPCIRTNASQALIPGNGLGVTACVGQPLNTPITGGIVQALYAFQGVSAIQQITGDQTTQNLTMNGLNVGTGTLGPATIVPTTIGMIFVSPEGLRMIDFNGNVSQPIGEAGSGVTSPFINVFDPTRMVAGANGDVIRISLQDARTLDNSWQEWWYDLARKVWSGPHSLETSNLGPYGDTFITSAADVPAMLYKSPCFPSGLSDFEEDGVTLVCRARTALLPDTEAMFQNSVNEATLGMTLPSDMPMLVEALDEEGALIGQVVLDGNFTMPLWGGGGGNIWGAGLWYAVRNHFSQFALPWPAELNFKQLSLRMTTTARFGHVLGDLRMRYQRLGYLIQSQSSVPMDIRFLPLPGAPLVNLQPQALVANNNAPQFTPIGAVLSQVSHLGPAVPRPSLALTFNGGTPFHGMGPFALLPYLSDNFIGSTTGGLANIAVTGNPVAAGWLPGHSITDSAGVLPRGTYILNMNAAGTLVTLSQPATRTTLSNNFLVFGTNLVTNWPTSSPLPAGSKPTAEIRATAEGYATSYLEFLVTIVIGPPPPPPPPPVLSTDAGIILTTDDGTEILTPQ